MNTENLDYNFFRSKLPELLKEQRGRFALIKNQEIQGIYSSVEDTLKNGYEKFNNTDFLVQEITDEMRINYINSAFLNCK